MDKSKVKLELMKTNEHPGRQLKIVRTETHVCVSPSLTTTLAVELHTLLCQGLKNLKEIWWELEEQQIQVPF